MIYAEWTGKAKGVNRWHQQGRGKIYKDPEYAAFQQDLTWQLRRANRGHKPMEGDVMVHINQIINPLRDIDSLVKPALDCLQEAGVIHDDRQIRLLIC